MKPPRVIAAVIIIALSNSAADARRIAYQDGAHVTTTSRHGNGDVSGPIRRARYGWQVQLPGGTWVDCRRSCEETLRVQSIDLVENDGHLVGYGDFQNQCGVFGCLELHAPLD